MVQPTSSSQVPVPQPLPPDTSPSRVRKETFSSTPNLRSVVSAQTAVTRSGPPSPGFPHKVVLQASPQPSELTRVLEVNGTTFLIHTDTGEHEVLCAPRVPRELAVTVNGKRHMIPYSHNCGIERYFKGGFEEDQRKSTRTHSAERSAERAEPHDSSDGHV